MNSGGRDKWIYTESSRTTRGLHTEGLSKKKEKEREGKIAILQTYSDMQKYFSMFKITHNLNIN